MHIILRHQDEDDVRLEAEEGWRLMEIIRDWEHPIKAECGGACICATCHIYIADNWLDKLPAITTEEDDMLSESVHRQENSRLSCQILMSEELNGIIVQLAPDALL